MSIEKKSIFLITLVSTLLGSDVDVKNKLRYSLKDMFSKNFNVDTSNVFIEIYHYPKNMTKGKYHFLLKNSLKLGHQTLMATTNGNNRLPVTINAAIKKGVYVATKPVKYRKILNKKDFELKTLLLDRNYNEFAIKFPISKDLETIRFIPEGTILKKAMYEKRPDLQRGEVVQVKLKNGNILSKFRARHAVRVI
jgi:flagella basal body P-ring formation protein FlgA